MREPLWAASTGAQWDENDDAYSSILPLSGAASIAVSAQQASNGNACHHPSECMFGSVSSEQTYVRHAPIRTMWQVEKHQTASGRVTATICMIYLTFVYNTTTGVTASNKLSSYTGRQCDSSADDEAGCSCRVLSASAAPPPASLATLASCCWCAVPRHAYVFCVRKLSSVSNICMRYAHSAMS